MSLGGGANNANQPCVACKHQRRKCSNCPLAPYFPAGQTQKFQNVHRLFGVSNVLKILKSISPDLWPTAMETIQYQADARRNDPVNGCLGIIKQLNAQIQAATIELEKINQQLSYCRRRDQKLRLQHQQHMRNHELGSSSSLRVTPMASWFHDRSPNFLFEPANENYNPGQGIAHFKSMQGLEDMKSFTQISQTVIECSEAQESSSAESAVGKVPQINWKGAVGTSSFTSSNRRRGKQCEEN